MLEILLGVIKEEIKGMQIGTEKRKPSLFADYMTIQVENPRELINKTPGINAQ